MSGMIGKKIGMTSIFDDAGNNVPCTVLEVGPNRVVQIKHKEGKDGYDAVQLGYGLRKPRRVTKAMTGHFDRADVPPQNVLKEFEWLGEMPDIGHEIRVESVFEEQEMIDVSGTSKGKGFQGVVRRHGFHGVNDQTHGQHDRQRAPGSIGASSDPSRVIKGMRMAGQMGNARVTVKNLDVVRIIAEHNLLLVRGAVPGPNQGIVELFKQGEQR
ncbi:MAG: 50S ribosomal protein L3 [Bacteroidetes bacterium]|nr:50S ribosomal protein L3 [Bacteroidota bacterium]MCY4224015.1 50S ribosomal protein L3 [Bacteroidota bacterium]